MKSPLPKTQKLIFDGQLFTLCFGTNSMSVFREASMGHNNQLILLYCLNPMRLSLETNQLLRDC